MLHHRFLFLINTSILFINLSFCMDKENETGQPNHLNQFETTDQNFWCYPQDWKEKQKRESLLIHDACRLTSQSNESLPYISSIENIDLELVEQLIKSCPLRLRGIVKNLKRKNENISSSMRPIPNKIVLLGNPGTGKSSLAQAIALYCSIPCTFVKLTAIHNEYKDSGASAINRICSQLRNIQNLHIIIFDELQCVVRKRQNKDFENDAAEALWACLDDFQKNPNIFMIGTANNIKDLPKPLLNRFSKAVFTVESPTPEMRKEILRYYLSLASKYIYINFSDLEIKQIVNNTKNCVPRDLKNIIEEACDQVYYERQDFLEDATLTHLKMENIKRAIQIIKENNGTLSLQRRVFEEYLKPNTGTMLQIGIPLMINLWFNYCMQQVALHHSNLNHQASMELARSQHALTMQQAEKHQELQLNYQKETYSYGLADSIKSSITTTLALPLIVSAGSAIWPITSDLIMPGSGAICLVIIACIPSKKIVEGGKFCLDWAISKLW